MKSIRKRLAAVLAALTLLVWCAAPAFALEVVDLSRTGSIKVSLYDSETSEAVGGGTLTLYRVAKVQKDNANLSFVYTNGFEDCGVELGDLSEGELAGRLAEKIAATAESTTVEISDLGVAEFGDLEVGLYLVVQTTAAENYNVINPFLVSVPIQENGSYVYDVDALPKVGTAAKKTPNPPTRPTPRTLRTPPTSRTRRTRIPRRLPARITRTAGSSAPTVRRSTGTRKPPVRTTPTAMSWAPTVCPRPAS